MSENIEFTQNYSDLSTNQGFQFEFFCNRCGSGFRTRFRPTLTSAVSGAMEELRPEFIQCPRCSTWVCRKNCWSVQKGLCKHCAPDLGVEMAAAQSSRTVEEIWAHSKVAEEDRAMLKEQSWREGVRATCPSCGAALAKKVKFCPECGAKIEAEAFCSECGAKLAPGAKFCAECGTKTQ